jgi:hypothetical protein
MPNWKKVILSGSAASLNSLTVSNGITGSLFGTASYASNGGVTQIVAGTNVSLSPTTGLGAVTINASVTFGQGTNTTASFSNTASWVFNHNLSTQYPIIQTYDLNYNQIIPQSITLTSPNTTTITFPENESGYAVASVGGVGVSAATASYIDPTFISASAAASGFGSGGSSATFPYTGSAIISGSLRVTGSLNATSFTGSVFGTSSWAVNATSAPLYLPLAGGTLTGNVLAAGRTFTFQDLVLGYGTTFGTIKTDGTKYIGMYPTNGTESTRYLANGNVMHGTTFTDAGYRLQVSASGAVSGALQVIGTTTFTGSINVSGSKTNTGRYGYVQVNASNASALITVSGSNTVGGTGYIDFLRVTNTSSSIATPTKTFRLNTAGDFEIISSNYATSSLYVSDAGNMTLYGSLTMPRRPAFRVIGTGASIASGTTISGSAVTVDFNQSSGYNQTTGKFTAPIAGLYQVNVVCRTASNSNPGINQIIVRKQLSGGGALTTQIMVEWAANTSVNHVGGSSIVNLAVGDTLWVDVTAGTISFDGNDNFSVAYIG